MTIGGKEREDHASLSDFREGYTALRNESAFFDLGWSTFVRVSGEGCEDLLQQVVARDLSFLGAERCVTTLVLDDDARCVDIVTVYRDGDGFLLESSPSGGKGLVAHLGERADGSHVQIEPLDGVWSAAAVEGPYAWGVVGNLLDPDLASLPFESVLAVEYQGEPLIFSRNGATGEYGYKFIGAGGVVDRLLVDLAQHAEQAGLDVLELAMLEVRQPMAWLDASDDLTIAESRIAWLADLVKPDFIGRTALLHAVEKAERAVTGFAAADDGSEGFVSGADVRTADGHRIGEVRYSRFSPGLDRQIGLVTLDRHSCCAGLRLEVDGRTVETVASPFIEPKSWKTPIL
jgi:glycine cleavage system aminomethyltransferase T